MIKTALVAVDLQNDFVNGSLGFEEAEIVVQKAASVIEQHRKNQSAIIFTMDTHQKDYLNTQEGRKLPTPHCIQETKGWELSPAIEMLKKPQDPVFYKNTFGSMQLGAYLNEQQFHIVTFIGLVSNICVLSNAIIAKSALPEAKIIIDASCVAAPDNSLHTSALTIMEALQIEVIRS